MLYIVLLGPVALIALWVLFDLLAKKRRNSRRARLQSTPLSHTQQQLLIENFPLYRKLPIDLQKRLEAHIQVFIDEKVFVGLAGFEITESVKILIAAQACLLILNKSTNYYPSFETILVYPEAYVVETTEQDGLLRSTVMSTRAGESWQHGPIVLAWDQVVYGARDDRDGHNVVMHEFAHKLDEENSRMDGLPVLASDTQYKSWSLILNKEYKKQQKKADHGSADVIDHYGATSPAEFFAVVTETFFEKPTKLKHDHPQLYQQFSEFYQLDPCRWQEHN